VDRSEKLWLASVSALAFVFLISSWLVTSWQEAKAYNRLTGQKVTTWDAMWVKLRVDRPIVVTQKDKKSD